MIMIVFLATGLMAKVSDLIADFIGNRMDKMTDDNIKNLFSKISYKLHLWWFTLDWWKYLLAKKSPDYPRWAVIRCRINGHKCGVVWYNPYGYEPNMTCKGCGDDLG